MSAPRLQDIMRQAVAEGVLPADARVPAHDERPWPVVLLTALGAWLAAIPLIGVVGLLLGDLARRDAGPYVVGTLVLAAAVVVLRSRDLPLFFEQLAVPALLVGGGSLGVGLYRDLSMQSASLLLATIAIALALVLARPWLRTVLGAAAATLLAMAATPARAQLLGRDGTVVFWWAWHLVVLAWCAGVLLQARIAAARPRLAAALESLLAGVLLATLAALAWWSGTSFLVGATLGDVGRELAGAAALHPRGAGLAWLQAGSALLAAPAAAWLALAWPSVRRAWCAGVAVVVVLLAWFMPALGAACLALAWAATSQRWRLCATAALSAVWTIGSFYYRLDWPLQTKSLVLIAAAAVLGALAWSATARIARDPHAARSRRAPLPGIAQCGVALCALATLAVVNIGIWQKERLIAEGSPLFIELAPVDPRSLMQGDYMRLNFGVPAQVQTRFTDRLWGRRPFLVARRDARGVATALRPDDGTPLAADELRIELTPQGGRWTIVTDAWLFREGEGERWSRARYGEFRVTPDGRALLVGLRGPGLETL